MQYGNFLLKNLINNSGGVVNRSKNTIVRRNCTELPIENIIDNRKSGVNKATNIIYNRGKEIHNHNYITNIYQFPDTPPWERQPLPYAPCWKMPLPDPRRYSPPYHCRAPVFPCFPMPFPHSFPWECQPSFGSHCLPAWPQEPYCCPQGFSGDLSLLYAVSAPIPFLMALAWSRIF